MITVNEYEFTQDTCIGYTSNGKIFLVDIEKFDLIKDFSWYINNSGYVVSNKYYSKHKGKKIKLHRLVTDCADGMMVDHIHGKFSRYDNRLSNLRICTNQENQFNRPYNKDNDLKVKGVSIIHKYNKIKYQSQIQFDGKLMYLGTYDTIKEASDIYDEYAKKLFGEFAWLNNYIATEDELKTIEQNKHNKRIHRDKNVKKENRCECGKIISNGSIRCPDCNAIYNRKVDRPTKTELKELIIRFPFTTIAKMFDVSDNSIRKWCKYYGLPYKRDDVKAFIYNE